MGLTGVTPAVPGKAGFISAMRHVGYAYRSYVSKDYPQPIKLPEMKRWVRDWTEEFGFPPKEVFLSPTTFNHQRTIDKLYELGVTMIKPKGGVLAWEVHIGPVPADPSPT